MKHLLLAAIFAVCFGSGLTPALAVAADVSAAEQLREAKAANQEIED
ncbi:MAG: hypothetical protein IPJ84_07160 [Bdellovibrionales bacterium]|nr:hypothetical protein [Bdellovibrionales bacterium]